MFFGAGNLIFPLLIGQSVGDNWVYATIGLGLTAVLVPFLGLAGMVFFDADYYKFFGRLGRVPGYLLLLLLQLILGPFGVIPRLFTLMHAITKPYFFDISLFYFSLISGLLVFLCTVKKQNIIALLGIVLTPVLLLSLLGLFFSGMITPSTHFNTEVAPWSSFLEGLLGGYHTMDLIAAFLFATVILPYFKKDENTSNASVPSQLLSSSLIAAALLLFTYVGLSYISAYHGLSHDSHVSEELLGTIAFKLLGPVGSFTAAMAVVTACLTTAISLSSIFADYLQKDLLHGKIGTTTSLVITLSIAVAFANLGFTGINAFLSPILQICYPGLIVLTVLNILHYLYGVTIVKTPVFLTFLISAFVYSYSV
jgi:LIVCS family branched-chain amino acid:cation transporter